MLSLALDNNSKAVGVNEWIKWSELNETEKIVFEEDEMLGKFVTNSVISPALIASFHIESH